MAAQPSTPSTSKGSNAFGKLLNKLRTPTATDNNPPEGGGASTPRSASPFSAMLGRRSSSKASLRSYNSSSAAAVPPFPPSLNGSATSLASSAANGASPPPLPLAFDTDDDDFDLPQFESEQMAYRPRGSGASSVGGFYAHNLASSSTVASSTSLGGAVDAYGTDYTAQPPPPRPSTSMSTRSRTESVNGSGGGGWRSALGAGAGAKEAVGSFGRGFGKSLLGRSKDAPGLENADDDELTHRVSQKQDELSVPARAPLTRLPSNDSALSSSQPSHAHLASTTPGLPRAGLSKSATSTLPSAGTRRLFAARSGGPERVVGRARRVVQPAQPAASTPDGPSAVEGYEGDQSASAKEESPDGQSSLSRDTSPEMAPPPRPRPPISPNSHGRSRSELPPASPKIASADRGSSTVTIGASSYLSKHSVSSSALRPTSSLSYYSTSDGTDTSPPGAAGAHLSASANARARLQPQAQGSTAFRNRFLSSGSNASISSSARDSPSDLPPTSAHPSPPMLAQSLSSSTSTGGAASAAGFKLAPMGGALSRKNSVQMLSSLAEDGAPVAARAASLDIRREAVAARVAGQLGEPAAGRASLDERRASPPRERDMMIPYAHRRGSSISRDAGQETGGTSSSSTHGGTTLVNGSSGGGLKRSNSETITQGSLMQPPAPLAAQQTARPGSSMSMYRDEPQQRPAIARVPSAQAYQPPPVMDVLPDQPPPSSASAFQPYHDENAYDPRGYARPAAPPASAARPALTEVNRPYPSGAAAPSTQPRPGAPLYTQQQAPPSAQQQQQQQKEYHVPLRDRSPGIAEATPSVTVQQQHYQSQQAYAHRQQYMQQQQQMAVQVQQVGYTPGAEHQAEKRQPKPIIVNGKAYHRAGILGRGGSSKVYRVMSATNELLALKRVDTRNDAESRASFINEITLLRKLTGKPEIIQLVDSEIQGKYVIMVMEAGETDLNTLLASHAGKPVSLNFIRYIWEQMLSAVQVIHDEAVVHSDLKPANFVLVKGRLKLIDFGISKAIAGDTTNIGRDQQIGTANYMPPEALNDTGLGQGGKRLMKLGRAADVWSLGCILYQMVYGGAPFSHLRDIALKVAAIQNPRHRIAFPDYAVPTGRRGEQLVEHRFKVGPDLLESLKSCLRYESKERATIPELLQQPFLRRSGDEVAPAAAPPGRYPLINDQLMEAVIKCIADKVHKGEIRSELDIVDIAQGLMKQVRDVQDTLRP
ncbi:Serine/threonine kinase mps1 [Rhodotorula kratochvilovae]